MFANLKAKLVAGLLSCACLFTACGFVAQGALGRKTAFCLFESERSSADGFKALP